MRFVLGSLTLLASLAVIPYGSKPPDPIREWHSRIEDTPLSQVETLPLPGQPGVVVASCHYQESWVGFFGIYCIQGNRMQWAVTGGSEEGCIHKARGLLLQGFRNPIIEVFGMTHCGNGSLHLYELKDRELAPLLETRAVDFHQDRFVFEGGTLTPEYRDLNGDGIADLTLDGVVEESGEKDDVVIHREAWHQVFFWDPARREFVEQVALRAGVPEYYD